MQRFLLGLGLVAASATAQFTVVAPNGYAATIGNSNNVYPWGRTTTSMRYQQVYDSTHFTLQGITYPVVIQNLRFRPYAGTTTTWTGGTWSNIRIDMASSPNDYLAASSTFSANLGSDQTTVLNGPVTMTAGTTLGTGVVVPWHVDIPLATPFVYDPTSGTDLTLDVYLDGTGWTGTARGCDAVSGAAANTRCTRVYDTSGLSSPTGTVGTEYGLVTEFTYIPAAGLFAAFAANVTSGASPLAVQFTDQTFTSDPGGVTSWAWDFDGDSVVDSTAQNPSWVYATCGTYNVSLTVTDASHPANTLTRTGLIRTDVVQPSFTYAAIAPGVIQFTDTSTPTPTSWAWDLDGDNIVDSTAQNPVWVYANPCAAANVTLSAGRLCRAPVSISRSLVLSPNTFQTTIAGGNGLSGVGSGNTFDIAVTNPGGIVICALQLCPYMATPVLGAPLGCTVWVTDAPGGYLTNHTNAAVWRQVATGTGSFAGGTFSAPIPVPMTLSNSIYLPFGNYAMAVHMTTGAGVAYTTLTAATTYAGPDFTITAGNGKSAPFNSTANALRGWNGSIHYSTVTNGGQAGFGYFGAGCAGPLGISQLSATTRPALGQSFAVQMNNLPLSAAIMMCGFSNTSSTFGPLPLSITPFGAPGCTARVSTDANLFVAGSGNAAQWLFNIPNNGGLLGLKLYNQAFVLAPGFNSLGAVLSDAHALLIGT